MTFAQCITGKGQDDTKHQERARLAADMWQEFADRFERQGWPRHQAEQMAGDDVRRLLRRKLQSERNTLMAQITVERRNSLVVARAGKPEEVPLRVLEGSRASGTQVDTVVGLQSALMRQFNGMMGAFLQKHARNLAGNVRNVAQLKNILRELHGEASGDETAAAMAKAVGETFERSRQLFNAAGGNIGKLDDFGLAHRHDRVRIMQAGETPEQAFQAWFDETAPRLAWDRIENFWTGKPFSADGTPPPLEVQRGFLKEIFDNIESDGWVKRDVSWGMQNGQALHRRYSESRVLHFKSADDWMAYNERFGVSDPFGSIVGHLHRMARDIAMMRVLGPSHNLGLENLINHASKRVAGDLKAEAKLKSNAKLSRAMLDHISGAANTPQNELAAKFFGGVRQVLSSAHLGSAMLVSGSDSVAMSLAAQSVGMNPANVVSRHIALMASGVSRAEAARMGYVADTLADAGNTMLRYLGEAPVADWAERLSSFVMRAQGLSFWTDMARTAFNMEFAGQLAGAKTLADLGPIGDALRARGISDADWAMFSDTALHFRTKDGARFASPSYWRRAAVDAGIKPEVAERIALTIDGYAQELTEVAVPSNSYEMRARVLGTSAPGSLPGEVLRSLATYKSYPLTFSINQWRQIQSIPTGQGRAQYVAAGLAGFTFMGAVGIQLKELAKGNEPRPMDNVNFWGAAALQGGGAGIVGDLLSSSTTRLGGGLSGYFAGPVISFGGDLGMLTFGNMADAMQGKDMNLGRDVTKFLARNAPGTTYWPTRAAMDRLVWDQMQLLLDPDAATVMQQEAKKRLKDYGNAELWPSGSLSPF
ncbi:hypothetical protein KM176_16455 [Pseudooceanicola sp. CBS1P-1]|uniref:Uncharacterized protein n=1 Tax=Pseudooceanicola albus TaxID=2692189 RepID=A0A6L7G527_9RHOB|nr:MULTISPECIES: hypothetical protein [Pseudooceanicola]MBT9385467.1 hypothetical protein [Pseudooceanicola endophyticus]MXN19121.1 hypothetical protein [Pseudooceanicola albus]